MSIQCQPVIGIDDRKPNMGFHMDYMTGMYFTDRSVNYNVYRPVCKLQHILIKNI